MSEMSDPRERIFVVSVCCVFRQIFRVAVKCGSQTKKTKASMDAIVAISSAGVLRSRQAEQQQLQGATTTKKAVRTLKRSELCNDSLLCMNSFHHQRLEHFSNSTNTHTDIIGESY